MQLSDLIPGYHTVETRNGNLWLVLLNKNKDLCLSSIGGWVDFRYNGNFRYSSDLTHHSNFDIVAIYEPQKQECYNAVQHRTAKGCLKLVHKVEEVKELTVDQISALLGYKVKVVGDEK